MRQAMDALKRPSEQLIFPHLKVLLEGPHFVAILGGCREIQIGNLFCRTNLLPWHDARAKYMGKRQWSRAGARCGGRVKSVTITVESGTVDFSKQVGQYAYVGIRSSSGAVYLASVEIVWE